MMREEEEEYEVARPPAYDEQRFGSRIEQDLGYDVADAVLRDQIAEEVYNPKPQPEFGFDPTVEGGDPSMAGRPLAAPAAYAANEGTLLADEEEGPTNLVASSFGYVMPKNMGDAESNQLAEEVNTKFGRATPQDDEFEEESESSSDEDEKRKQKKKKKKDKKEESPHQPHSALDTVAEENEARKPKSRPVGAGVDRIQGMFVWFVCALDCPNLIQHRCSDSVMYCCNVLQLP